MFRQESVARAATVCRITTLPEPALSHLSARFVTGEFRPFRQD
jgi:hypothetical protein